MTDKRPEGRPTVMTEPTLNKLKEAFILGCTDEEACYYAEISTTTLYKYQEKHPEFVELKEAFKQRPILLARQSVVNGLVNDPNLALKYLERKKKDEFSLRQEFAGVKDKPLIDVGDPQILKTLLATAQAVQNRRDEAANTDSTQPE